MVSSISMIRLEDYQPLAYSVLSVDLEIELGSSITKVRSRLHFKFHDTDVKRDVTLNGEFLRLLEIAIDGKPLMAEAYKLNNEHLTLIDLPENFVLETLVEISPAANLALSGLYMSGGNFCTQCEPEGFRRITYFPDRPDIMSVYRCKISADKASCPVLLCNGNLVDSGDLPGGRHWVTWEDPSKKPSYLFALVAGQYECVNDDFDTMHGRKVKLEVYVEPGKLAQARYALGALKRAMQWDESEYARAYDLDRYMIVAVSDFNFGAMENKGLNIFNDRYILAKTETATDADFLGVETVVGHEYFHNWTGNRITLRNWFQLCLKEGLTVYREQSFSAAMTVAGVRRIEDAKIIETAQFSEEAGPMAHPVRPDAFSEISNFYTLTVYNKGAEVARMLHTWLGDAVFKAGMQYYFDTYDGQAISIDEFLKAMAHASQMDMSQFKGWYTGVGTPVVKMKTQYDKGNKKFTIQLSQSRPTCRSTSDTQPRVIPIRMALLDRQGQPMSFSFSKNKQQKESTLIFDQLSQTFEFEDVDTEPVCSVLRHFSAPVKLLYELERDEALLLVRSDNDAYVRWRTLNQLYMSHIRACVAAESALPFDESMVSLFVDVLQCRNTPMAEIVEILAMPSEQYMLEQLPSTDIGLLNKIRKSLIQQRAVATFDTLESVYLSCKTESPYRYDADQAGIRSMRNFCLMQMVCSLNPKAADYCLQQLEEADNMTDMMGAIHAVIHSDQTSIRKDVLTRFYEKWQHEPLVVDKWLSCQAMSAADDTLKLIQELTKHECFDIHNPNRVRALIGVFSIRNIAAFHDVSGQGYSLLTDFVLKIDQFNAQLATRLCQVFVYWKKYDDLRQSLMKSELERIWSQSQISKDLKEVVSRALNKNIIS